MKRHSGSTLLAVLTLLVILSAFILGALGYTMSVSKNVARTNALRAATEIGDGALEYAYANWRAICRVNPSQVYPSSYFTSPTVIPLPTAAMFPSVSGFTASAGANPSTGTRYTIANFGVQAVSPQFATLASSSTAPAPAVGMNIDTNSYYYLATATVTMPGFAGRPVTVNVNRIFQKQQQSPWNYAIFFNDLLEINPGAQMTITGWVHTNSSLYTGMSDLTFNSRVDFANDWADGTSWAPGDNDHPANTWAAPSFNASIPPVRGPTQEVFGVDVATINAQNGTTQTAAQIYSQLLAPGASNADFGVNSYYNQAAVRIIVNSSNVVTYHATTGVVNGTTGLQDDHVISGSSTGNDLALYNVFSAAVTTGTTIQDNRQGASVRLVQLNMSTITSALTAKSGSNNGTLAGTLVGTGFNGIIYASDSSGTSTTMRGIELTNGATLPVGGLTVVSNNGIYIQGDYNTGQTSSVKTPANTANNGTGSNVVSGYDATGAQTPSAVIGDAVMILSNNWSNGNSTASLPTGSAVGASSTARNATPTTVNAAIVSGNVPTGSGGSGAESYSGGAENFPRFLENWSGVEFTYYGSMVELFQSQQFAGYWGANNVYSPPNRNWNFDTTFYTNPPPGTLIMYSFLQQRWFVQ